MKTSDFLDFYILETIQHFVNSDPAAEFNHAKNKLLRDVDFELTRLARNMAQALHDYIYKASFAEARHALDNLPMILDCLDEDVDRSVAYKISRKYSPKENYKTLAELFENSGWSGSFGGKLWLNTIKALDLIYVNHVSDKVFVDYCADLKHNNGLIFDKPVVFSQDYSTSMLMIILSKKRDVTDFCKYVCDNQWRDSVIYGREYIHFKTAQLAKRYMMLYYQKAVEFYGNKDDEDYTPEKFGHATLEIVANPKAQVCSNCGDYLPSDDVYHYNGVVYCHECYDNVRHPEITEYCDRCGKKRSSTNQYIYEEQSLCHACYDIVVALDERKVADNLFKMITGAVVHK